jgi:hypothetical protein
MAAGNIPDEELPTSNAPKSAFDIAKQGGKHSGWLKTISGWTRGQIESSIRSYKELIDVHTRALTDPKSKIPDWDTLDPRQQRAILDKEWPSQIARQKEQLEILEELLKNK